MKGAKVNVNVDEITPGELEPKEIQLEDRQKEF